MKRKSCNKFHCDKKGIFSFDLCIAIFILIFIIYYSFLILNLIESKISFENKEKNKIKLHLISELVVKRSTLVNGLSYSNLYKKTEINLSKLKENLDLEYLRIDDVEIGEKGKEVYCIERLVIIDGGIKKIKICI